MGGSEPHNWFVIAQRTCCGSTKNVALGCMTQSQNLKIHCVSVFPSFPAGKGFNRRAETQKNTWPFYSFKTTISLASCSPMEVFCSFRLLFTSIVFAVSARHPIGRRWGHFKASKRENWALVWMKVLIISYLITFRMGRRRHLRSDLLLQGSAWWRGCDTTKIAVCDNRQLFLPFGRRECPLSLLGLLPSITLLCWSWPTKTISAAFWSTGSSRSLCGDGQLQAFSFGPHPACTEELHPFTAHNWGKSRYNCQNEEKIWAFASFLPHV